MLDLLADEIIPLTSFNSSMFLSCLLVTADFAKILYLFPFLSVVKYSTSVKVLPRLSLLFLLLLTFSVFFSFTTSLEYDGVSF